MRDFRQCPGRRREDHWRDKQGRETAICGATSAVVGFDHGVGQRVCETCSAQGAPDMSNPLFRELVVGRLKARLWARPEAKYPDTPTREQAFHQLVADRHLTPSDARHALRKAVNQGLPAERAADMADAEGVGDQP